MAVWMADSMTPTKAGSAQSALWPQAGMANADSIAGTYSSESMAQDTGVEGFVIAPAEESVITTPSPILTGGSGVVCGDAISGNEIRGDIEITRNWERSTSMLPASASKGTTEGHAGSFFVLPSPSGGGTCSATPTGESGTATTLQMFSIPSAKLA